MQEINYTIFRGDTFSKTIIIKSSNEINISQLYFTIKAHLNDRKYVVQKKIGDGITKLSEKKFLLTVLPEDTNDLKANGTLYNYDIELIAGDLKKTAVKGTIKLESDVTRPNDISAVDRHQRVYTEDADAVAADIALNKAAYVKGQKVVGTLDLTNLTPENIKKGVVINGVEGTYEGSVEEG